MAVPKHKTSKARKRTRSAHNFMAHTDAHHECPHCHAVKQPHKVCLNCGYYNGKQVIETKADKKEAKKKAQ
ncbi:MAG: 50S ribosomal protein L32 [Christensenellaceae bacterium]|nr:50S ribosomal protein L32 [Christensenellaceae bacterium]